MQRAQVPGTDPPETTLASPPPQSIGATPELPIGKRPCAFFPHQNERKPLRLRNRRNGSLTQSSNESIGRVRY